MNSISHKLQTIATEVDGLAQGNVEQGATIMRLREALTTTEATIIRMQSALVRALDLLQAHEAWEADLILTGDWADRYVRMKEHHHEKMLELQQNRNDVIAVINEATKGSSDAA